MTRDGLLDLAEHRIAMYLIDQARAGREPYTCDARFMRADVTAGGASMKATIEQHSGKVHAALTGHEQELRAAEQLIDEIRVELARGRAADAAARASS